MIQPFFRIEMLPALHGDCLLVEYGTPQRTRRLLIDGGPIGAFVDLPHRDLPAGPVDLVIRPEAIALAAPDAAADALADQFRSSTDHAGRIRTLIAVAFRASECQRMYQRALSRSPIAA